ncbi:MAG TPA: hypothetical protein VMB50_19465 [Myxococcales bacterium]|nr:hypothetical protein [Myxococcales bacterium]
MRRLRPFAALGVVAAASCFVGTLELTGLPCPCLQGYVCMGATGGTCQPAGPSGGTGGDAGPCAAPVCSGAGALLLCDGGIVSCAAGNGCDYGACAPLCRPDGGCAAGQVCDQSPKICVGDNGCTGVSCTLPSGTVGACVLGICTPLPQAASETDCVDGGPLAPDAGPVSVNGILATFPGAVETSALAGGTVVFSATGVQPQQAAITLSGSGITGFTLALQPGVWTVTVTAPGVAVPTIFPNLVIQAPRNGTQVTMLLPDVVPVGLAASTQAGHIVWVGTAGGCGAQSQAYVGGYTVGFSPAPPAVEYYAADNGFVLDADLRASSLGAGAFIASDAPYAVTQYVMAVAGSPTDQVLLSGTFTPPPDTGQTLAVALLYPNTFP